MKTATKTATNQLRKKIRNQAETMAAACRKKKYKAIGDSVVVCDSHHLMGTGLQKSVSFLNDKLREWIPIFILLHATRDLQSVYNNVIRSIHVSELTRISVRPKNALNSSNHVSSCSMGNCGCLFLPFFDLGFGTMCWSVFTKCS